MFEHPKQTFRLMEKKMVTVLRAENLLIWTYVTVKRPAAIFMGPLQNLKESFLYIYKV